MIKTDEETLQQNSILGGNFCNFHRISVRTADIIATVRR